ncbi:hypothetical protein AGABI1DRAFT_112900 [Agaricus bisporus var. burnettii JB137-S8]|uniref:Uncharacterized protein n=2 Tax=Agaricus bisporus var. burnettii TaxID=192524 RepID=K5Y0F2_AGABU|nr:uncharacterized protein AGABI1DRAFT_112900 [Agaricus bisporus var. burnettii JB137-S8]EKM81220.1 hypothetical protein AGABI1DRAFT_112900 [Agaricus bisporus var. burnettii JB137-S8]KAF7783183.1 hypothetical protein Agabi119p4_2559 [Agaricus bisporus var. burnettii]
MSLSSSPSFSSLTSWSMQHINDIFEAPSDEESLRAVDTTFSRHVEASVNGKPIQYRDIQRMVLALRTNSNLTVSWQQAQESPDDAATNQSGKFNGSYIIKGIQRTLPDSNKWAEFERHKKVEVEIEPLAEDASYDSRKITRLAFVATDVRVPHQASL